jgi:hypothetical protein
VIGFARVVHREVASARYSRYPKNRIQMILDGLLGYAQALSDLSVVISQHNKSNNLTLTFRE